MSGFDEMYRKYAPAVYRLSLRAVSRPEVAEDITSEVFLALRDQYDRVPKEQLPAWLFTVAKRRAADYWRHHHVELRWASSQVESGPAHRDPEFPLETLLGRCPELKPVHRLCLILKYRHGMSRTEIAKHLNYSEMQIKSCLQYGLKLLRESLEPSLGQDQIEPKRARNTDREKGFSSAV